MKKVNPDEVRTEYRREDLVEGTRGKYFKSYQNGSNLVLLKPTIAKAFPTEKAVNEALQSLINIAQNSIGIIKQSNSRLKAHS